MRKYLNWRNVAIVAFISAATTVLGGYWYIQHQQVKALQQQIDQVKEPKDRSALVKDRIALENTIAGTLIQGFGGFFFVVTAYVSLRTLKATQQNVSIAQRNLLVSEEKQVTERFTQAINQLGSKEITTRIGGIYALERIAKDSPKDYWTIMEVLTSFIQEKSPIPDSAKPAEQQTTDSEKSITSGVAKDVQAALTVIGRREPQLDLAHRSFNLSRTYLVEASLCRIDLCGVNLYKSDLRRALFQRANLQEVNLSEAYLQEANLSEANLQEANLCNANLSGADLHRANLSQTNLSGVSFFQANLNEANIKGADLSNANFAWANLENVDLREVDMYYANLSGAHLYGANFSKTKMSKVDLTEAELSKANFRGAKLYKTKLNEANLREADFTGADIHMTDFRNAKNLTSVQVKAAKNWEQARYDEDFRQQLGLPSNQES